MEMVVTVVGIGADGWAGVPERNRALIIEADVVLGGERHLALLPDIPDQIREAWPRPLRERLIEVVQSHAGRTVVALASGDPMLSGIGSTLVHLLGPESVRIVPAVSSVTLARARMLWPAETTEVVSVVGRDTRRVARMLAPGLRLIVLSSDAATPTAVAALLADAGYGASVMTVLSELDSDTETRVEGIAATWRDPEVANLNVVAVELISSGASPLSPTPGLPDDAFEHDGQITKRDVRASALARLEPLAGQTLWDVGAGAGSVGVEWMRVHPTCYTIAIEARDDRAQRIGRNAALLGVPELEVVTGSAPEALEGLPPPDAIFVGGGATEEGVLDACWSVLQTGGRLVVHGVTLETEAVLALRFARHGGELTRLHVEHAASIGTFTGWSPARTITQWAATKDGA